MSEFMTLKEAGVQLIDCVHKTPQAKEKGCYYIAIPQMKNGGIDTNGARLISEEDFNKWTIKANPQKWDIVLSRRCNPGVTSIVTGEFKFALGQNLVLLRSDGSKIYPPFLKWLVNSQYWWAEVSKYLNVGAVFESLRCADVPNFKFPVPAIETQKEISRTLENLDKKITLLRQQNQDLEELSQTLFKRWFVEFEFPDENGKPYLSSGGKMIESELGEIPEGWKVGKLCDEFNVLMGQSPSGSSFNEIGDGEIFYQGRTDFGFRFPTNRLFTNEPKRIANKFDVLVSVRAPVGDINMANERCCIGRGLAAVKSELKSYCFNKLKWMKASFDVFEKEGTVFGSLSKNDFNDLETIVPINEVKVFFDKTVSSIDMKIFNNSEEIQTLTQLRDTLLPKLMSGELRVKM